MILSSVRIYLLGIPGWSDSHRAGVIPVFPPWFRQIKLGELVFVAFIGLLFLVVIGLVYRKSNEASKEMSKSLMLFIAGLLFFGIVVDGLHTILNKVCSIPGSDYIFGFIEDGGEMIMMSFIVWYVYIINPEE